MSLTVSTLKAPFPWFGGKRKVAQMVWNALGDVQNYVEPFFGSGAVLLARPPRHQNWVETINDRDAFVANFWRALSHDPDAIARYADWPVNEADLFARHLWLVNEGKRCLIAGMDADPEWYDAKIAGWWLWGICQWIGSGWCSGTGPHTYDTLPVEGDAGRGVNRQLVHLGDAGQGINRGRIHLGTAGQGVNRKRMNLDASSGVLRGGKLNHQNGDGLLPRNEALYEYMRQLAARLRNVRVCCGDWARVVTRGALNHGSTVGVFLDPPYSAAAGRDPDLYAVDDLNVAHDVREWCIANGDNPRYRLVLAGYEEEHASLMPRSWRMVAWKVNGGQANNGDGSNLNRHKERLWLSPHCLRPVPSLFEFGD